MCFRRSVASSARAWSFQLLAVASPRLHPTSGWSPRRQHPTSLVAEDQLRRWPPSWLVAGQRPCWRYAHSAKQSDGELRRVGRDPVGIPPWRETAARRGLWLVYWVGDGVGRPVGFCRPHDNHLSADCSTRLYAAVQGALFFHIHQRRHRHHLFCSWNFDGIPKKTGTLVNSHKAGEPLQLPAKSN